MAGPRAVYGPRKQLTMYWPEVHLEHYQAEAAAEGRTLNDYLIRLAARAENIPIPDDGHQLVLGA